MILDIPRLDFSLCAEKGSNHEGPGIGKEDLRQVQGDHAQGCSARNLRKRKAQAAPGVSVTGISGTPRRAGTKGLRTS